MHSKAKGTKTQLVQITREKMKRSSNLTQDFCFAYSTLERERWTSSKRHRIGSNNAALNYELCSKHFFTMSVASWLCFKKFIIFKSLYQSFVVGNLFRLVVLYSLDRFVMNIDQFYMKENYHTDILTCTMLAAKSWCGYQILNKIVYLLPKFFALIPAFLR